jgi:hypothetical protein
MCGEGFSASSEMKPVLNDHLVDSIHGCQWSVAKSLPVRCPPWKMLCGLASDKTPARSLVYQKGWARDQNKANTTPVFERKCAVLTMHHGGLVQRGPVTSCKGQVL